MLDKYKGSYPLALAAYNAGHKRVDRWLKINGDPRKKKIHYAEWIELIPFKETRNYVQRVLENVNVYRYITSDKPIKLYNFFEN
jgi:soluble lytic murein transglycosylase